MNSVEQERPKIMIVDDNLDILLSLRELFEIEGYEVVIVDNGWKCLQELDRGFKGIIILDLMMPIMNGVETIKNMIIEGFIEDNVIVVLTVKKIQGKEFDEIYPYIYEYITKPFDINELLDTVDRIVREKLIIRRAI
jgi:DNA-binding response OmpR family regulator